MVDSAKFARNKIEENLRKDIKDKLWNQVWWAVKYPVLRSKVQKTRDDVIDLIYIHIFFGKLNDKTS